MSEDRILVQVPADELPLRVQALIDPGIPRPAGSRFLARRTHVIWIPAAWLVGLLVVGISSVRATISAGLDPSAGDERIIYGALAAVSLVGAVFAAGKLLQALTQRREVTRGTYRTGLHVLGRDGLLIAGSDDRHTWVPRALLPPATDVTDSSGGGTSPPAFAYLIVDDNGRMDRLDCGAMTQSALWMWAQHGQLPEGSGWM